MSLRARVVVASGDFVLDAVVEAAAGETIAVLGPNGAGKTTLLRALAGLAPLRAGTVALDDTVLDDPAAGVFVPPERRPIGMVFQRGSLFPHLSARDNVAFGLRCRGATRAEARRRAAEWLERVGLAARSDALPATLSGGEAQRVALARALATAPRLLLLDEPLAALDTTTKAAVRRELQHELASFEGVRLLVTHDPVEARALADHLIVLEHGAVVQRGSAGELTARPRSRYVADLAGLNLYRGVARGTHVELEGGGAVTVPDAGAGEVFVVVHPRAVALHREPPLGTPRNVWRGAIAGLDVESGRVRVRVTGPPAIVAEITPAAMTDLGLDRGVEVWVSVKATEVTTYPA